MKVSRIIIIIIFCFANSYSYADYSEYLVKFRSNDKISKSSDIILSSGAAIRSVFPHLANKSLQYTTQSVGNYASELRKYHVVRVKNDTEYDIIEMLRKSDEVEEISINHIFKINNLEVPNDQFYNDQWALSQINALRAWQYADGEGIIIAVIDTGIDFEHPDLVDNLWINSKEDINGNGRFDPWSSTEIRNGTSGDLNGIDDDGNGFVDDVIGFDMVSQKIANFGDWQGHDPVPFDEHEHGTVVSGVIAAAQNNEIGISGLAHKAKIMTLRAFDATGNAYSDNIASAIVYAAMNGAKVLNFSFGEVHSSPIVHTAVKFADALGVIMIASSGNENKDIKHYPSDYPEVISVGASKQDGRRWDFSNYGGNLCLLAPGHLVMSTVPNNQYSLKSGTSLAAPYVSAAAAMLLQNNPNFTKNDIKATLAATATSVNPNGWDIFSGAGILNIAAALEHKGSGKFEINYPAMHSSFNKSKRTSIPIIGSAHTPLFDSYAVLIGKGRNPVAWDTIAGRRYQLSIDDTLAMLDLSAFADTNYTVAVRIFLKNLKILETRTQFTIYSNANPFALSNVNLSQVFYNDKNTLFISANTNHDSNFEVHYRKSESNDKYAVITDFNEFSQAHHILLDKNFDYDTNYEAIAKAFTAENDTVEYSFNFQINRIDFPKYTFSKKNFSVERAFIEPTVLDFNGNGKPNIFYSDISTLGFGNAYFAEFSNNEFVMLDSIADNLITTSIGNTTGDDKKEVLMYGAGRTVLYKEMNNLPFGEKIFESQQYNFWAEHLYDINGDGKDEIIAHNDSSFFAYGRKDDKYELLASAVLPNNLRRSGVWRGSAVGDFNGNGKANLYHSNNSGHSFIWEWDGSNFQLIYHNTDINGADNQFVASADINGDGKLDIIHGTYAVAPRRNDPSANLWLFRIISHDEGNNFKVLDSIYVYGVRAGAVPRLSTSYRNGIATGKIEGYEGKVLALSAMPNLYVFSWDNSIGKLKPLWHYPAAFSNSAWIYDFDGNGKAEIGFSTFGRTEFWEHRGISTIPAEPTLDGWASTEHSAELFWNKVDFADEYEILTLNANNQLVLIATTTANTIIIDSLEPNKQYSFFVVAISEQNGPGQLSNELVVFTYPRGYPLSVEFSSNNTAIIEYDVKLPELGIEPSLFAISDTTGKAYIASSAVSSSNKIILSFTNDLENGDYTLHCKSFRDYWGNPTFADSLDFSINIEVADEEIYLRRLTPSGRNFFQLEFSESVDSSALNPDNYTISPFGKVLLISPMPNNDYIFDIVLSSEARIEPRGQNYYLTARNIKSIGGRPITKGSGNTLAFSVFADNLDNLYVFPHPIKYSEQPNIYIAGLTRRATIEIFTIDGALLKTLSENDGKGGVLWDGTDNLGRYLPPGIYLIKAKNTDNLESDFELKKFMVVP